MELVPLGRTGRMVSRVGLGLAALGRPGYINLGHGADFAAGRSVDAVRRRTHRMLDLAYERGIRYFDAARSYGRAEEFLGSWLGPGREEVTVGSKWGYTYTADWNIDVEVHEVKDHGYEALERQLGESRSYLADGLDLYQIHSATLDTGVLDDERVHRRLAELSATGVAVGISTSGPRQSEAIHRAIHVEVNGEPLFGAVQATWNLLEPSAGAALADAADAGMAVIVKEAVANGRLTNRNPDVPAGLAGLPNPDAIAIAAALAQPWTTLVLSGAATREQLESNLTALTVGQDVLESLPDLAEPPRDYWSHRAELTWN